MSSPTLKEAAEYGRAHAFDPELDEQMIEDMDSGSLDFEEDEDDDSDAAED
jgi:hypothetical protein